MLLTVLALMSIARPAEARRGSIERRTTSGTTRHVDSPSRVRVRYRDDHERSRDYVAYDDDGAYDRGDGEPPPVGIGMSFGVTLGVFDADFNPLSSTRAARAIDAGLLLSSAFDGRFWIVFHRLRAGFALQGGAAFMLRDWQPQDGDAFEEGSSAQPGSDWKGYLFGAYQPQLSEHVQLWFGGRIGIHGQSIPIAVDGRPYASLGRFFVSLGPELGVRFTDSPGC